MNFRASAIPVLAILNGFAGVAAGQRAGDEWVTVRGDQSPGLQYPVATTTAGGRILAAGDNGSLMISDDGGANWRYDRITVNGLPVFGTISTLHQASGGRLIAVLVRLEEVTGGPFKFEARSYFLISADNGNTWTMEPFPRTSAVFRGNGRTYSGVHIMGLHAGPGGQLLAYGTISFTNFPAIVWSLGGLIFRQTGTGQWEQALYEFGPVDKITNAGGRAVATAYSAILDSADGAGWNGYQLYNAQVSLDGGPMDPAAQARLRVLDVEVFDNGTFLAQGARFAPIDGLPNVDSWFLLSAYRMTSPAPFSGARPWTAFDEPYRGTYTKVGNNILSSGSRGTWVATEDNAAFTLTGPDMRVPGSAIAVSGDSTAVAVQSSEIVWKSTNGGNAWTRVLDRDPGPDLIPLGCFNGVVVATASDNSDEVWLSRDNGASWEKGSSRFTGSPSVVPGENGKLFAPAGKALAVSEDGGLNWTEKPIEVDNGGFLLTRTPSGRLIMPVRGWDVRNEGKFYVSDDDGGTWAPKNAGLAFGEVVRAVVTTKSGRVIVATNTFALFDPSLVYSDDNGETWKRNNVLQSLEGLDTVTGSPEIKVTEILEMKVSSTGRIIAMDENAIFTSDNNGDTWVVRTNQDFNGLGPFHLLRLRDIIQTGSRWVALGSYSLDFPLRGNRQFLLISDDDGATWGMRPFETRQSNTSLSNLGAGVGGRLIMTGSNGAVFISDPETPADPDGSALVVREGSTTTIPVSRPDVDGAVAANYITLGETAQPGVDFVPLSGVLQWAADDMTSKSLTLELPDNNTVDGARELSVQIAFETADGLVGRIATPIRIEDNDGGTTPGIVLHGAGKLYTHETGGTAELGLALRSKPSANVILSVTGLDESEGRLSADTFTFTPENWGILQTLTITGVDDAEPDGDVTYNLLINVTSDDSSYTALGHAAAAVVNRGDEPLPQTQTPVLPPGVTVSLTVSGNQEMLLKATGLDPSATYVLESSPDPASFQEGQPVTGAALHSGHLIPRSGSSGFYRIRPLGPPN